MNSNNDWIKLYEQTPPVYEAVELKVVVDGKEGIQINRLAPTMDGKYVWDYCDYDGCEVLGWRKIKKDAIIYYLLDMLKEEHMGMEVKTRNMIKEKFGVEL